MTDKEQKKAAKEFAAYWKDKGSEKSDTQTYWNQLLTDVFGAEKLTGLVKYEKPVTVDGNQKYIDVYIRHDNVTIIVEQKNLGKDLKEKRRQSDGEMLNAYEQAQRYDDKLNKSEQADYIITCNFSEFNIYDMNDKNAAPVQIMLSDLPKEFHLMKFLVGSKSERIKKEEQLSYNAGQIVGKMRDALKKQYVDDEGDVNLNKLCVRLVFCFYKKVSGQLLYAKTDNFIQPDHSYSMSGNQISVKTLDLDCDFTEVKRQLNDLAMRYFGE